MALPSKVCTLFLAFFLPCSLTSHCNQCDAFLPDLPLATQERIHKQGFSYSSSGSLSASTGRPAGGRVDFCYKRLGKTPRNDEDNGSKEKMTVMEIAEDLEEELNKSMNRNETVATEQSFIGCLDGWIWAHRNDHDTIYYGDRMENVLRMMERFAVAQQQQQQGDDNKELSSNSSIVIMSVDPYATVIHLWLSSVEEDGAVLRALRILALMEGNQQIIQQAPIQLRLIQYNKILKGLVWSDQTYHVAIKLLESMYNKSIFRLLPNDEGGDDSKMKDSSPSSFLPSKKIQFKVSIMPDTKSFATVMTPLLQKEGIMDPTTNEVLSDDEELLVMLTRKASELNLLNNFLLRTIEKGLKDEEKMKFLLQQLYK